MRIPLFLAHGNLVFLSSLLLVWLLATYGIPAFSWRMAKRKKRKAAVILAIVATVLNTALTLLHSLDQNAETNIWFLLFDVPPLIFSVRVLVTALSLPKTSPNEESPAK
jgi:hypothetical protein